MNVFRSSNFAPAFYLLSPARRRALKAVYAFCRDVDDVVDRTSDPVGAHQFLQGWRTILEQPCTAEAPNLVTPEIWAALEDVLRNHKVDPKHLLALVDGVERDLFKKRYATFEELKTYCHGVASTVGLACLPIFGLDEPAHSKFAVNLGLAVQMINILRT
ncbi:MAG: squalene/phytoene synthase family protein [Elusimicrobia bacterium]|nr:squalene/phytoene synthase family protein [Elusimicrobiota bacterium]